MQKLDTRHVLRSHRKITKVQEYELDLDDISRLRQKATF